MLNIALLQMQSFGFDQIANMKKGITFCREAKEKGADIALFPEMWNIGYTPYDEAVLQSDYHPSRQDRDKIKDWQQQAITLHSDFIQQYQSLAKELNMAIAITYLEAYPQAPKNTVSLIDRQGDIVLTYAKVHTCDFSMETDFAPGCEFSVCDLDTEQGLVKVGAMICFDREFPESARILILQGAEIIVIPNSCELEQNRIAQINARAFENMVGIAVTNYPVPKENGHSLAFDGIAFDQNGSRNHLLVEADGQEAIVIAHFDLDKMRDYRSRESWGNAYRKPKCYKKLIDESVQLPFIRPDAKR